MGTVCKASGLHAHMRIPAVVTACALMTVLVADGLAQSRTVLGVLEISDLSGTLSEQEVEVATDFLRGLLVASKSFSVVDKSRQEETRKVVIKDLKRQSHNQCYDEKCRIELGRAMSADSLLVSKIGALGGTCTLTCELISLEKETVETSGLAQFVCGSDGLLDAMRTAVEQLAERPVDLSSPPLDKRASPAVPEPTNGAKQPTLMGGAADSNGAQGLRGTLSDASLGANLVVNIPLGSWSDTWGVGIGGLLRYDLPLGGLWRVTGRVGFLQTTGTRLGGLESSWFHVPLIVGLHYFLVPEIGLYAAIDVGLVYSHVKVKMDLADSTRDGETYGLTAMSSTGLGLHFRSVDLLVQLFNPDVTLLLDGYAGLLVGGGYAF